MEMCGQFHAPAALPRGESPWYPLDMRLGDLQGRSGQYGEVNILDPTERNQTTRCCTLQKERPVFINIPRWIRNHNHSAPTVGNNIMF
jgi:hypothetical protein